MRFAGNEITVIPESISALTNLRQLWLSRMLYRTAYFAGSENHSEQDHGDPRVDFCAQKTELFFS